MRDGGEEYVLCRRFMCIIKTVLIPMKFTRFTEINKMETKVINVLEYDEYRLKLQGFKDSINDLRDSL